MCRCIWPALVNAGMEKITNRNKISWWFWRLHFVLVFRPDGHLLRKRDYFVSARLRFRFSYNQIFVFTYFCLPKFYATLPISLFYLDSLLILDFVLWNGITEATYYFVYNLYNGFTFSPKLNLIFLDIMLCVFVNCIRIIFFLKTFFRTIVCISFR